MAVICVRVAEWGAGGPQAEALRLLESGVVPRIAVEEDRIWADGRGLPLDRVLPVLRRTLGERVRCGVAETPVAADVAALSCGEGGTTFVPRGGDRDFLGPLPLSLLAPEERVAGLLEGVGVLTCGQLASIPAEAVEVRFGADAVALWRLARAEDRRRLFRAPPRERPHASLDFVDYVVTNPEQLVFTAHALLGSVCGALAERGEHARSIGLELPLANGQRWSRVLRAARPSASRAVWLRLSRALLERLTVEDAVAGMELHVLATEPAAALQGDLFDAGFATSSAVEAALARLLETQGPVIVHPESAEHPLPERSTTFTPLETENVITPVANTEREPDAFPFAAGLTLQLLPQPRGVLVESVQRRDHKMPIRFRDDRWRQLATVAGPDRLSGGFWEDVYAREYFRGVTAEGTLVLLYHDAREDAWYLHGWWD